MSTIDIQLIPGGDDWGRLREASLAADEGGFATLWVCDHLAGYSMSSETMHEAFSWLGALAEATTCREVFARPERPCYRPPVNHEPVPAVLLSGDDRRRASMAEFATLARCSS